MLNGTPARQSHAEPRSVTILGATGSIGSSTVDLLKRQNGRFTVKALTAHKNGVALAKLARDLNASFAAVADHDAYRELKSELSGSGIEAASGSDAVAEAARRPAEWVIGAITGTAGLEPSLAAIERGATLALANKESLVCAGTLVMRRARETGATVLPVDSEHNALFQAMTTGRREDVTKVIITASGGPFRTWTKEQIEKATLAAALKHPNWSMGPKVTIDPTVVQNMGVRTAQVMRGPLDVTIRTVGMLKVPEPGLHDVNLKVNGWVDKVYADTEGMHVEKDQPLFWPPKPV